MSQRKKREKIEYYGEKLYLQEIAIKEDLVASTLRKCYRQIGDIYKAVEQCKQISRPKGYIVKIEYNGEMLTLHAIAKIEEISKDSLKRSYLELGDIYEAVKTCKQNVRGEVERIKYKNQKLSIGAIAKIEDVDDNSLRKNYLQTGDIHKAIRISKQNARVKIDYKGEMLTIHIIAQREGIRDYRRLKRVYSKTKDIYEAIRICKSTSRVKSEKIEIIEYYGEKMTVEKIAQKEGIDVGTLNRYYKKTRNIYDAVSQYLEDSKRKVKKIKYENGEMLAISAIAKREKIDVQALTNCFKETGDIFEAVKKCKEKIQKRKARAEQKEKVEYKGKRLLLKEIAQREGIDTKYFKMCLRNTQDVYKAVFIAKYSKRKNEVVDLKGTLVNLYDMSLLIGVRYRDLINLLNAGMSINEIKEKYVNQYAGENIRLRSGRTLLEFCTSEGLNFAFMYRAIHTYGKTCKKAVTEYGTSNKSIPIKWIYEKYDTILKKLGITGLQSMVVVKDLQDGQMSLEEALEINVLRRNASKNELSVEWGEALYSLIKMREILGEEYQSQIQLNEKERAFIDASEAELLELKRKIQGCSDPTPKKRRGALIEQEEITY